MRGSRRTAKSDRSKSALPLALGIFTRVITRTLNFLLPKFTRALGFLYPHIPAARAVPSPVRFRARSARPPYATRTRYLTRTRAFPVLVAPAARHYPATRETFRSCIPATCAPRVPVTLPTPVRCPSPWHLRPVSSPSPCGFVPAVPVTRHYPTARTRVCPYPHRGACLGGI